jgi:hypothetical protein
MFSIKELKAFSKKLSGKDGRTSKPAENRDRGRPAAQDRRKEVLVQVDSQGPRLSTHRSGYSDDFKKFIDEEDDVVAFESPGSPHSGDFSLPLSTWTRSAEWSYDAKVNSQGNLQF